jgi:hypothetical protein
VRCVRVRSTQLFTRKFIIRLVEAGMIQWREGNMPRQQQTFEEWSKGCFKGGKEKKQPVYDAKYYDDMRKKREDEKKEREEAERREHELELEKAKATARAEAMTKLEGKQRAVQKAKELEEAKRQRAREEQLNR